MKPETMSTLNGIVIAAFFETWIVLGIAGFLFFYLGRDAALKRRWFPRFVALGGVLFVLFATTLSVLSSRSPEGLSILVLVVPAVLLISWLNIKHTKFCDECGATTINQNWFASMKYCPRCGASFESKPSVDDDPLG